jgi:hypothetical protein
MTSASESQFNLEFWNAYKVFLIEWAYLSTEDELSFTAKYLFCISLSADTVQNNL